MPMYIYICHISEEHQTKKRKRERNQDEKNGKVKNIKKKETTKGKTIFCRMRTSYYTRISIMGKVSNAPRSHERVLFRPYSITL